MEPKQISQGQGDWYVLYILAKSESKVKKLLDRKGIETFLPLTTKIRQWSDRTKRIKTPLFPKYLFARLSNNDFPLVFETPGFIRFLSTSGQKDIVPESEIDLIKDLVSSSPEVSPYQYRIGEQVVVTKGPLQGREGKLIEIKGKKKLVVFIEALNQSLLIEIPSNSVEQAFPLQMRQAVG